MVAGRVLDTVHCFANLEMFSEVSKPHRHALPTERTIKTRSLLIRVRLALLLKVRMSSRLRILVLPIVILLW